MPYFDLDPLLEAMLDDSPGISDLNLSVGRPPQVELDGQLRPVAYAGIERLLPYQTELIAMRLLAGKRDLADSWCARVGGPLLQPGQAHPLPRERLRPARQLFDRAARHPEQDPHGGGARDPAAAQRDRQRAQRHRARDRSHRLGQVHHPGRHHQQDQPGQRHPHHHHRGPDRVPAPARQVARSTSARSARTPRPSPSPCAPPCARRPR